jgi:hypothetical protein
MGDAGAAAQPDGGDEAMIAADSAAEAAVAADGNPQFFSRRGGGGVLCGFVFAVFSAVPATALCELGSDQSELQCIIDSVDSCSIRFNVVNWSAC